MRRINGILFPSGRDGATPGIMTPFASWRKDPDLRSFVREIRHSSVFRSKSFWIPRTVAARFDRCDEYSIFRFWRGLNLELWSRSYGITNF